MDGIKFRVVGSLPDKIGTLRFDSRLVEPGDLFFAIKGTQTDGNQYIPQVEKRGAVAIVTNDDRQKSSLPMIIVENARAALSRAAANFYHHPSQKMTVIGITGTNGKTTSVYLLNRILERAKIRRGTIGTLGYTIIDTHHPLNLTTPDAVQLQEILAKMVAANINITIMEVSSHALSLNRVDDIRFQGAVFTNISQDHLDFYGNIANYVQAKTGLFKRVEPDGFALYNIDDPQADAFRRVSSAPLIRYALKPPAELYWQAGAAYREFIQGTIQSPAGPIPIECSLAGQFNLYNILAAVGMALQLEIAPATITEAISDVKYIPGRLQEISRPGFPRIFVDYAHTPDAITNVLKALRNIVPSRGRLITVFGCGGGRDKDKRPKMSLAVEEYSHIAVITTDNPRNEAPEAIIEDALPGFSARASYQKIVDRKQAIEWALRHSKSSDIIAILGKGHETYQEIKGVRYPFSDVKVVKEIMETE